MTTLREAAQQALDALEYGQHTLNPAAGTMAPTITPIEMPS